ncbi:MAG: radical SAM protein, partial [Candidatus Cloacimonetes bacterium]|nr:radical SAM protein [Candidatus Cloacimonadota bacterium]
AFCQAGAKLKVNIACLHHGEEPVISGTGGSGTIFFSHCNLRCVFCQNYQISSMGWGEEISIQSCAELMLSLQEQGAHNINLVTPTHFTPQIKQALILAKKEGLTLPILWNSNAYEKVETLKELAGLIDIYLPDLKYAHSVYSKKYSKASDYPQVAKFALKEMFFQAGNLHINDNGIAQKGLLIRHLVLPNALAGSRDLLLWIKDELGTQVYISLMAQYYPAHQAIGIPELARGITQEEYDKVLDYAQQLGFANVFYQELSCSSEWTPEFCEERKDAENYT